MSVSESVHLGFLGDVMLGRNVEGRRRGDPPTAVWGDVRERLHDVDGLFANLECCLSTRGRKWRHTHRPFHFRAEPEWAIEVLEAAGVDWVSLANNHVLDYEEVALRDTLETLSGAGIGHAGAGEDETVAWTPSVLEVGGLTVAVVACTDNTPEYAADAESPGVAWTGMDVGDDADLAPVERALDRARAAGPDLVVASLHWGPNMVAEPDEAYVDFGHWLVDQGVDIVHGHSAHVVQGIERYDDGLLLYDCGDVVDDYVVDRDLRNDRSFVFEVRASGTGDLRELLVHPVEIDECAVRRVEGDAAEWCRRTLVDRSRPFGTSDTFERADEGLGLALAL